MEEYTHSLKNKLTNGYKKIWTQGVKQPVYTGNPRYNKGETVYLKEPYFFEDVSKDNLPFDEIKLYKFNNYEEEKERTWKNKLFMPEKHARYFIKITDVKVEELQDITESNAISEGIEDTSSGWAITAFETLWDSINKKAPYRWEDNPYVWVYEFELITKTRRNGK